MPRYFSLLRSPRRRALPPAVRATGRSAVVGKAAGVSLARLPSGARSGRSTRAGPPTSSFGARIHQHQCRAVPFARSIDRRSIFRRAFLVPRGRWRGPVAVARPGAARSSRALVGGPVRPGAAVVVVGAAASPAPLRSAVAVALLKARRHLRHFRRRM